MSAAPVSEILSELRPLNGDVLSVASNEVGGHLNGGTSSMSKATSDSDEHYERGFAAGVAKAKAEQNEDLERRQLDEAAEAYQARMKLVQDGVDALVKQISEKQGQAVLRVQSMVSDVLRSLIDEQALSVALKKIEDMIVRELDGRTNAQIQLSGPESAVSELIEKLNAHDFSVETSVVDGDNNSNVEVQVQLDSSVIRTRLEEWKLATKELLT